MHVKKNRNFLLWVVKGDLARDSKKGAVADALGLTLEEGEATQQYKYPLAQALEPSHTQHFSHIILPHNALAARSPFLSHFPWEVQPLMLRPPACRFSPALLLLLVIFPLAGWATASLRVGSSPKPGSSQQR